MSYFPPVLEKQLVVSDVPVPRALLVLCEEVLSAVSHVVPSSLDDDYELALAQLRIILK
jgi:hypothetical protein